MLERYVRSSLTLFAVILVRSDNCRGLTSPPIQYTASFPSSPEQAYVHVSPPPNHPHLLPHSYSPPLLAYTSSLSLHPGLQSPHVSPSSLLVSRGCCEEGPLHGSGVLPEGLLPPPREKVGAHQDPHPLDIRTYILTYVVKAPDLEWAFACLWCVHG